MLRTSLLVLLLAILTGNNQAFAKPIAQEGLLDLTTWDFDRDGALELNGAWQFYWHAQLDSSLVPLAALRGVQPELMEVPSNWNATGAYSNLGFATYRLEVLIAEPRPLALKLRTVGTAYRLYVDGVEKAQVGRVGQSTVTTEPDYDPQIITFTPNSKRIEIIFQVANFEHRNAGLWEAVVLGTPQELRQMRQARLSSDLILFGAIVMMALYNLITWVTRRENISGLWLGLFCLLLSTRILFVDERFVNEFLRELDWSSEIRFEYITWFLSIPIFLAFIRSMFPTEASMLVLRTLWLFAGLFIVLALVLPTVHVTSLVPPYQYLTLLGMAYGVYCVGLAIWRRKEGSILFGVGSLCLFVAATSDIATVVFTLDANNQLQTGLFVFVLLQSIQVSLRSSKAFQTVEAQSSELRKTNLELHIQEKLRKAAEGESQALHARISQSSRSVRFGIVADALADRLAVDDSTQVARETLYDLARLLRGQDPSWSRLDVAQIAQDYFQTDEFKELKLEFPLIDVTCQFEASELTLSGSLVHLKTLLYHLARYSLATQIQAQQVKISGRTDYVYAGSLFHHQVTDGDYYIISIEDQGQGIRPEDLVEIFDPEQKAKGYVAMSANLKDLAVAWTILEDHGGALDVHSLAEATRLELYFPISNGSQ